MGAPGGTRTARRASNQDCTFRRQAKEDITYSTADPSNVVAGQNDSRVGFNQCGIDYSLNDGRTWGDMLPPFRQSVNDPKAADPNTIGGDPGDFHTYDAASDPVNATDSRPGVLQLRGVRRGRQRERRVRHRVASRCQGFVLLQLPEPERTFMPVQDNSPLIMHDKSWIAADHYVHSRNRDNVYVTWTVVKFDLSCRGGKPDAPAFCESPIYGSMSTDNGHTWFAPEEINGARRGASSGTSSTRPSRLISTTTTRAQTRWCCRTVTSR